MNASLTESEKAVAATLGEIRNDRHRVTILEISEQSRFEQSFGWDIHPSSRWDVENGFRGAPITPAPFRTLKDAKQHAKRLVMAGKFSEAWYEYTRKATAEGPGYRKMIRFI